MPFFRLLLSSDGSLSGSLDFVGEVTVFPVFLYVGTESVDGALTWSGRRITFCVSLAGGDLSSCDALERPNIPGLGISSLKTNFRDGDELDPDEGAVDGLSDLRFTLGAGLGVSGTRSRDAIEPEGTEPFCVELI